MKEITILTQEQFDALVSPSELTLILIKGNLQKINKNINNTLIYICGSAKIDSVCGSAQIGSIYDSTQIGYVCGSAKIGYVCGSAKIDSVYDSAKIDSVCGSAKIDSVYDSAQIGSIYGSAKIGYVCGSAKIDSVCGSAKIDSVCGSAKIGSVCGCGSASIYNSCSPILNGFSVIWAFNDLCQPIQKSLTSVILRLNLSPLEMYFNSNPIDTSNDTVILYKKVSRDFLTQENTFNETKWMIKTVVTHPSWNPTQNECGEGKFHACSKPIFCDEFRNKEGDKYICLEVKKEDLFAWKDPQYPHKIAFRTGLVLYECDRSGKEI